MLVAPCALPRLQDYGEGVDMRGSMMYIANALDHLSHIGAAGNNMHPLIVLEDDLLAAGGGEEMAASLQAAVRELPASADILYLEFCFETCQQVCCTLSSVSCCTLSSVLKPASGCARESDKIRSKPVFVFNFILDLFPFFVPG
jgi:hypothetical protein